MIINHLFYLYFIRINDNLTEMDRKEGEYQVKKIIVGLFASVFAILIMTGCTSTDQSTEYNQEDYDFSLLTTDGIELNPFAENDKVLFLYFTGVD